MQKSSCPADAWIEEALATLAGLSTGMEGQVSLQQAAICLLQARRDGKGDQELEGMIQNFAISQVRVALNEFSH